MKKVLPALVLISFLVVLFVPLMVSARAPETCTLRLDLREITGRPACTSGATIRFDGPDAICCFFNTVYNIIDWVFVILMAVAILLGLMGAFHILTSAGAEEKVTTGRNYILYAVLGVIVALVAKAIPSFIRLLI